MGAAHLLTAQPRHRLTQAMGAYRCLVVFFCAFLVAPKAFAADDLVVFLLIDATRADHLSSYGYGRSTTPVIDQLALTGTRFDNTYANAPWTRPSTVSFLTGLNASRHLTETENSKLPDSVTTLAGRLKKVGWQTLAFVANGNAGSLAGLQRDFDLFEDPSRTYTKAKRGTPLLNGLPVAPFIVDRALQYLDQHRAPKQFVFLFFVDPHDPYEAPPELEKAFLGDFAGVIRRHATWEYNNDYPAAERFSMMAVYDAGIRAADRALGVFLAGLKAQGRLEHTTFVISADHGEGFGEHGFYLHAHQFWDEVIHIPLIISGPLWSARGPVPKNDPRLSQSIDVTATLAGMMDASSKGLIGTPLYAPPLAQTHIISEYNEYGIHRQAIMSPEYKVVWQRPADTPWFMRTAHDKKFFPSVVFDHDTVQVYDRLRDPGEKHDLAASMPPPAQALLATLKEFVTAPR